MSNKFSYHLKKLEEEGLIHKQGEFYSLTSKGKSFVTYLEGTTGKEQKQPLSTVVIVVIKNDKVLMQQRLKEPFYGYWGFPSGKQSFGTFLKEAARKELFEEVGLEGDLEYKGLVTVRTFNNNNLMYHHNLHLFKCSNPRGELQSQCREGKNQWIKIEAIKELKTFPDVPIDIEIILERREPYHEMDRFQKNDEFV
ncbi:MAG: NUDIX domain-containing protein [Promethearchaeota archaeon]